MTDLAGRKHTVVSGDEADVGPGGGGGGIRTRGASYLLQLRLALLSWLRAAAASTLETHKECGGEPEGGDTALSGVAHAWGRLVVTSLHATPAGSHSGWMLLV